MSKDKDSDLSKMAEKIIKKPSFQVNESDEIRILENETLKYVSRGGLKLEKAINKLKRQWILLE